MRARVIGALAAAVLAVLAGPVWATVRPIDFPDKAVLVDVAIPRHAAPTTARERGALAPAPGTKLVIPAPAAEALPAVSKPQDLVRVVFTIKANDAPAAASSNSGVCPAAPTCDVFGITAFRFPARPDGKVVVNYKYNDANRRDLRSPDAPVVRSAIHAAAAAWMHWDSRIVLNDTGDTAVAPGTPGTDGTCADGTNVIGWGRFDDPDAVGEAMMCLDRSQHVIRDADIMLNISYWWSDGPNARRQTYDVQEILTHEMGHWLSLQDMYSDTSSAQTMHGSADPNEIRKRTPALGDIAGLQTAYPCRPGDSCPRSGIAND
jgi:hypothetical protein